MTLDAEVRALEREARARPDDGAAQVGLAAALARLGRENDALEAFLRAASTAPQDPSVARALDALPWWGNPRGSSAGTRAVPVRGIPRVPQVAAAWRLGPRGESLALGRGLAFVRVTEERPADGSGDERLVAVGLATGREVWSRDETALASAPPLVDRDTVYDATLVPGDRGLVLRVRARHVATGRERWSISEPQPGPATGALFATAAIAPVATGGLLVYAVAPHGRVTFDPFLRILDAATGTPLVREPLGEVKDLAIDDAGVLLSAKLESPWRVESWHVPGPARQWQAARDERTVRAVATPRLAVLATEQGVLGVTRATGEVRWRANRRLASPDALVVSPRLVVGSWQRDGTSALDLETGETVWRDVSPARILCAADTVLYAVTGDGTFLRALDLATGEELWTLDLALALRSHALAANALLRLAVAPSRVVGLTRDGALFVLAS